MKRSAQQSVNHTTKIISHHQRIKIPLIFFGIITGAITGIITCLYRFATDKAGQVAIEVYGYVSGKPLLIALLFLVLIILAILVSLVIKFEPLIMGSGIPQIEGVLLRQIDMKWWKVLIVSWYESF